MSSKENADYLLEAATRAGITDKKELGNFMGQMQVECGGFGHMSEGLNYSGERLLEVFPGRNGLHNHGAGQHDCCGLVLKAVANAVYGGEWGKKNLGNTEPGDGWKFHGRGYVQLTGRDAYERIGKEIGQGSGASPGAGGKTARLPPKSLFSIGKTAWFRIIIRRMLRGPVMTLTAAKMA